MNMENLENNWPEKCNLKIRDGVIAGVIETGESLIVHDDSKSGGYGGFLGKETLDPEYAKELYEKYAPIAKSA